MRLRPALPDITRFSHWNLDSHELGTSARFIPVPGMQTLKFLGRDLIPSWLVKQATLHVAHDDPQSSAAPLVYTLLTCL